MIEILLIIIIHFIGDFVLQTHKQAQGKSKNCDDLFQHTFVYSIFFGFIMCFILPVSKSYLGAYLPTAFFLITFICHTVTDYYTSRLNSKIWAKIERYKLLKSCTEFNQDYYDKLIGRYTHNFFVAIGFDQVLHYIQLFLTYQLLK